MRLGIATGLDSYRRTTLLIVGFVMLCMIGAFRLAGYLSDRELADQKVRTDVANRNLAMILTESVSSAIRNADILLRIFKGDWETNGALTETLQAKLPEIINAGMVARICIVDDSGKVTFNAMNLADASNIASRNYFQQHKAEDGGEVLLDVVWLMEGQGPPMLVVSRRLNRRDGSFGGVASVGIRQEYLLRAFRELDLGNENSLSLLHTDGKILARLPGEYDRQAFAAVFRSHPSLTRVKAGEMTGEYEVPGADGIPRLGSFRKLSVYPVVALATTKKEAALSRVLERRRLYQNMAAGFSFFVLVSGLLIWLQLRRQYRTERTLLDRERELTFSSYHDALTGIYNRAYFYDKVREAGPQAGVIMADMDGLKVINDTFGHKIGDQSLIDTAGILVRCISADSIPARIGGDEFAVYVPATTREAIEKTIQTLRQEIARYNDSHDLPLQLSLGFALADGKELPLAELMATADKWMYREKLRQARTHRSQFTNTLKEMLVARDYITEGHVSRVTDITIALAKALGLPSAQLPDLELFAYFHDIGKVGVSDRILNKCGPLTEFERHEMQQHSEIGHRIASSADDLSGIADWILKHHERWDGKGYPWGVAGEDIPIQCRILAIADAYDAMTSDRPYRKAMHHQDALAELRRNAGTQFDPTLVEKFIEIQGAFQSPNGRIYRE